MSYIETDNYVYYNVLIFRISVTYGKKNNSLFYLCLLFEQ